MRQLAYRYYDFFERSRSKRNFVASVFFGIIAGGLINLLTPYFSEYVSETIISEFIPWILLFASIALIFMALEFSSRSEKMSIVYEIIIHPENVSSICESLLSEIKGESSEEMEILRQHIKELQNFFEDRRRLKLSGVLELREHLNKLLKPSTISENLTVNSLYCKLGEYLKRIEDMEKYLVDKIKESGVVFKGKDTIIVKHNQGFLIKKKSLLSLRRPVVDISIEPNVENDILVPAFCIVTVFPQEFRNFLSAQRSVHQLLNRLRWFPESMQLGIDIVHTDETLFLDELLNEVKRTVEQSHKKTLLEIESLQRNLDKLNEAMITAKKEKKKNARPT